MATLLTIGDFSRMTHLTVKALRHYHEVGLLEPAMVDPSSGYRRYTPDQVPTAQVIRRLRDLGMPVDGVRSVLMAPDGTARNAAIVEHLRQMEEELERTRATVASLRALIDEAPTPIDVAYRSTPPTPVLAVSTTLAMDELHDWGLEAFTAVYAALDALDADRAGPDGALYSADFFQADRGEVTAFVPVRAGSRDTPAGEVTVRSLPATELAVAVHRGSFDDLDTTYGALGTFVARHEIGIDGPIRENYLVTAADTPDESRHRTEVCWPVFHTTPGRSARTITDATGG